jgi:hypothetical protein
MPMRNHINVVINAENNLACTALMYVASGAPAATHNEVYLGDINTIYFVLKNQLPVNQTVKFSKKT